MKVLLVDDSPVMRRFYNTALTDAGLNVVAEASDPFEARDRILATKPDVLVLDLEMPRMDGLTFLRRLMKYHPLPVVVCSSLTTRGGELTIEALEAGAVDVLSKPSATYTAAQMSSDLVACVRAAGTSRRPSTSAATATAATTTAARPIDAAPSRGTRLVAIGASTGGTVAIEKILQRLPATAPPVVVTQHMPAYIVGAFVARLARLTAMTVREATDGEELREGVALIAPGGRHLLVEGAGGALRARVKDGPLVNGHRPSVDVLFRSVARAAGAATVGVILTGMGRDGAKGLREMREVGAHTIAQDEATSVVFGMPGAAVEIDAAADVLPLDRIAERVLTPPRGAAPTPRARGGA